MRAMTDRTDRKGDDVSDVDEEEPELSMDDWRHTADEDDGPRTIFERIDVDGDAGYQQRRYGGPTGKGPE